MIREYSGVNLKKNLADSNVLIDATMLHDEKQCVK